MFSDIIAAKSEEGPAMSTKTHATVEDLYRIRDRGKAEIVGGEVVRVSPTGDVPGRAGGAIYVSLRGVERRRAGLP